MATTSSSPGRSPRRKNVEKRGIYWARGNLSSGEYIFLGETEGSTLTCVARLPRDTPIYRLYNGSRPNTHLRTARMRNQYRDSVCPDSGQFSDWIRAYNLLHRWLLFINTFVETIFDLVSWESAIFFSLTRTVDSPCHDNVSYLFDRYLYVSDNSYLECLEYFSSDAYFCDRPELRYIQLLNETQDLERTDGTSPIIALEISDPSYDGVLNTERSGWVRFHVPCAVQINHWLSSVQGG